MGGANNNNNNFEYLIWIDTSTYEKLLSTCVQKFGSNGKDLLERGLNREGAKESPCHTHKMGT